MTESKRNILEQVEDNFDLDKPARYGGRSYNLFYDWFCKDESLTRRGTTLAKKYLAVQKANAQAKIPWFDPSRTYLFFKNNAPMAINTTYDDFRICDLESGDVLFTIAPAHPRVTGTKPVRDQIVCIPQISRRAEMWGRVNNFDEPLVEGSWKDILEFFKKGRDSLTPREIARNLLENPVIG